MELYQRFDAAIDLSGKDFEDHVEECIKAKHTGDLRFDYVRKRAHAMAFMDNGMLATGKFFSDYKTLLYTYCFRHNIQVPRDWKGNY